MTMTLRVCRLVAAKEKRTLGLFAVAGSAPRGLGLLPSTSIHGPIGVSRTRIEVARVL